MVISGKLMELIGSSENMSLQAFKIPFNFFLDLLFPIECLGCGAEEKWLCKECRNKIKFFNPEFLGCPQCKRIVKNKASGSFCSKHYCFLNGLWIVGDYKDEIVRKVIHYFKYKYIEKLDEELGQITVNFLEKIGKSYIKDNFDLITFVPLHRRRLAERGYNQSELLAKKIANHLELPMINILKRNRYTKPQVDLNHQERFNNVKDAFSVNKAVDILKKRILLIDDVYTTGSTLKECAKLLKKAQAKRVWALVLAKG